MKKKVIECELHGFTLFKCKRNCWKRGGKEKAYADEYTEKCFKCIDEGKNRIEVKTKPKKEKHIRFK